MIKPKKKILIVFGTRPEAIKLAQVIRELQLLPNEFDLKVYVTAQHREMLDQVMDFFEIVPDIDLDLMKPEQRLNSLTACVMSGIQPVLNDFQPDYVVVQGDTTTSVAVAMAAFYQGIKVCHIEAGLRTYNKQAPFPEEVNRQITSRIADLHFAPTIGARDNLRKENIPLESILVTGNTGIDSFLQAVEKLEKSNYPEIDKLKDILDPVKKILLVTGHRRESFGKGFEGICDALIQLSKENICQIVYPVHLNPKVQKSVQNRLTGYSNIYLMDPLSYPAFVWLMKESYIILTDSGGIQEEAPYIGKPVLIMRESTERVEILDQGNGFLVGTNPELIVEKARLLLANKNQYKLKSQISQPYGKGEASKIIANYLLKTMS